MGQSGEPKLDSLHCRAICEEIGERLRIMLDVEASALPPRLQVLMLRLAAQEMAESPSITPSIADMAAA
ncbi:MAG: hypothetical protein ACRC1G_05000 [Bradyrhizobium sp.]|nr:hypothetical protein [Bradyrhizobium sp.]